MKKWPLFPARPLIVFRGIYPYSNPFKNPTSAAKKKSHKNPLPQKMSFSRLAIVAHYFGFYFRSAPTFAIRHKNFATDFIGFKFLQD